MGSSGPSNDTLFRRAYCNLCNNHSLRSVMANLYSGLPTESNVNTE